MTQATLFPAPHVEARPLNHDQAAVMDALTYGRATAYELVTSRAQPVRRAASPRSSAGGLAALALLSYLAVLAGEDLW